MLKFGRGNTIIRRVNNISSLIKFSIITFLSNLIFLPVHIVYSFHVYDDSPGQVSQKVRNRVDNELTPKKEKNFPCFLFAPLVRGTPCSRSGIPIKEKPYDNFISFTSTLFHLNTRLLYMREFDIMTYT